MDIFSKNFRNLKKFSIFNSQLSTRKGFTLIELIVVIAIIAALFVVLGSLFNPFAQLEKAKNATRQQDLNQIKEALDSYFNDTGCYPTGILFGKKLSSGNTVYMQKVPQDPECNNGNSCYDYETDGSTCPQWNILYAQMHQPIVSGIPTCVLSSAQTCLPSGGLLSYNYCQVSGKLDCNYISQHALPTPPNSGGSGSGNGGGGGNGGSGGITPTPIPTSICNSPNISSCSNGICNVKQASQCLGCGGTQQCYTDLVCGGVDCSKLP